MTKMFTNIELHIIDNVKFTRKLTNKILILYTITI